MLYLEKVKRASLTITILSPSAIVEKQQFPYRNGMKLPICVPKKVVAGLIESHDQVMRKKGEKILGEGRIAEY